MSRVVLGVTGGIAAYKAVQLARLLTEAGHAVRVVPTANALEFVGKATWQAISGTRATSSVFEDTTSVDHVALGREADVVVVAPATADFLARAAAGLADDLLTCTLLVTQAPVVVAPAMHSEMLAHPATQANLATLANRGVKVLDSPAGRLTGRDSGPGRMMEPEDIFAVVSSMLAGERADLAGRRVVVSAGGTREALDPVRFLGNSSSGKQGFAIAKAAALRGAEVALVAANVVLPTPPGVRRADVSSALELRQAMEPLAQTADIIIQTAAVADFRPAAVASAKVKRANSPDGLTLQLVPNPDILAELIASRHPGQLIVGFAAETGDEAGTAFEHARAKAMTKGADLIVANVVGQDKVFGQDDNDVVIFDSAGHDVARSQGSKDQVAQAVLDAVAARLR